MKKMTLKIHESLDERDVDEICEALNEISGVLKAEVSADEGTAYAYCGNRLTEHACANIVREAGYSLESCGEEYITDIEDYKKCLSPL